MSTHPRLLSLGTAVPPYVMEREAVIHHARHLFEGQGIEWERMVQVYANAGVEQRHSCVPIEWYLTNADWAERNRLYVENAVSLAAQATEACLRQAGLWALDIDAVVAVSTSGIATPSLDALLMQHMGMRREVLRLPVFGLGCAGGVIGLARAAALAKAHPGLRVLLVVVELCGLTFRASDTSKSNMVATALFGDGAAAALLCTEGCGPALTGSGEHTWPDSLDVMGWRVENDGLGVIFSRAIPCLVRNGFRAAVDRFLDRHELAVEQIGRFVCHPGGAKVVEALEQTLDLPSGALDEERDILRRYGNMSAATVLFVLERVLAKGLAAPAVLTALGPGFTAGFQILEAA